MVSAWLPDQQQRSGPWCANSSASPWTYGIRTPGGDPSEFYQALQVMVVHTHVGTTDLKFAFEMCV